MEYQGAVKAGLFAGVVGLWALARAWPRGADGEATRGLALTTEPPLAVASTPAPAAVPTETTATPAADAVGAAAAEPPDTSDLPATPTSAADELALQTLLESDARAYTPALQSGDAAAVGRHLAARCRGVDVGALVARRLAELKDSTGISLQLATVTAPLVGHFDTKEGVAHAFLGLAYRGKRLDLPGTDGWLFENGHWRNAEC